MSKLSPIGALVVCWFIGIVSGKPGIWFPLGVVAMVAVALWQRRRGA